MKVKRKSKLPKKIKRRGRKELVRELDRVFSLFVRARGEWKCQLRGYGCSCGGLMQCNHLVSRSKQSVRWDEKNAISGCSGHNAWASHNPVEWRELWTTLWPAKKEYLLNKSKELSKPSDWTLQIWINEYREKFQAIEGMTPEEYVDRKKWLS